MVRIWKEFRFLVHDHIPLKFMLLKSWNKVPLKTLVVKTNVFCQPTLWWRGLSSSCQTSPARISDTTSPSPQASRTWGWDYYLSIHLSISILYTFFIYICNLTKSRNLSNLSIMILIKVLSWATCCLHIFMMQSSLYEEWWA